ncbi:MAG: transglutaminase family protein [Phycisphaeraceae bacterium]
MAIRVALHHRTHYGYDRPVSLASHLVRLRPAPHCRTPIVSYSLKVKPADHFINWQQDPYSNHQARLVFNKPSAMLTIDVDLIAELPVINPFDFFIEEYAEKYPFTYEQTMARELTPYFERKAVEPKTAALVEELRKLLKPGMRMVDVIVAINTHINKLLKYIIRMEPGVQSPEETLTLGIGSCRDFAWLVVSVLRELGLAARFVSGYSIQLVADVKALDGPSGVEQDCCDLHAWAEVYLPGAGWIGLDATSSLITGEGHIPLACTADPTSAAPVTGSFSFNPRHKGEMVQETFKTEMSVRRVHEDPRVTKPYTLEQWRAIDVLGERIDDVLKAGDVRLTMGGEPTFVSIDDMDGPEWNTEAFGKEKRRLSGLLVRKMHKIFAPGGLLHFGQGKWYPGEQLPRWALAAWWRKDGEPIWQQPELFAGDDTKYDYDDATAERFIRRLAELLNVNPDHAQPAYEDAWYHLWKERRLPVNVDPFKSKLKEPMERKRLAKVFEQGLDKTVGYCLPLAPSHVAADANETPRWISGAWAFRAGRMYLIPGDSPMGYRLPLDSLAWYPPEEVPQVIQQDVMEDRPSLPPYRRIMLRGPGREPSQMQGQPALVEQVIGEAGHGYGDGNGSARKLPRRVPMDPTGWNAADGEQPASSNPIVRTALCVEPRGGALHIFVPPARFAEQYLDLIAAVEQTAAELDTPVFIEGYAPPHDHRLDHIKVTPDPGVIEVNMHPASDWSQLARQTHILYDEARTSRLGTEKFMIDGRHSGTGGGNHVVLGGPTPADSPFLRRPDLLRSFVGYWQNHPALSYLFSGLFIGPTSQAPRADEGRSDALYEMEIAFQQIPDPGEAKQLTPWLVDRTLRNILTDITGNTHRAEFCIDKLFSPDSATGRLGLVEFRAFEMPPHWQMSMTQQLLLRALVATFWNQPYKKKLINWGTSLHGRYLLPHFLTADLEDVIGDLNDAGFPLDIAWFAPHIEFRFPRIGSVAYRNIELELRTAIEPWNVLGEEGAPGGTARYVDSSVERVQVKVKGLIDTRHVITCNGRRVPLHPTGVTGEFVASVRYRAWQPPSCLHPTIQVHSPLIFDVLDTWSGRSIGGCTYHVTHPGGRSFETFPVNAYEAESRRYARFQPWGHSPGRMEEPAEEENAAFPYILDLRRS